MVGHTQGAPGDIGRPNAHEKKSATADTHRHPTQRMQQQKKRQRHQGTDRAGGFRRQPCAETKGQAMRGVPHEKVAIRFHNGEGDDVALK
jgi:hypothetical protein